MQRERRKGATKRVTPCLAPCDVKTSFIMEAIVERTPRTVTVRMSTRRWNRMLQLEETYKLARIIKRSMKQVESEPSMTQEEAIAALRAL